MFFEVVHLDNLLFYRHVYIPSSVSLVPEQADLDPPSPIISDRLKNNHLHECIDSQNTQLRVTLGVVPDVSSVKDMLYIRYRYTNFFCPRSCVAMFLRTSGNNAETSFPKVMAAMVF